MKNTILNRSLFTIVIVVISILCLNCSEPKKTNPPAYQVVQKNDLSIPAVSRVSIVAMADPHLNHDQLFAIAEQEVYSNYNYEIIWVLVLPRNQHVDHTYNTLIHALYVNPAKSEWTPFVPSHIEETRDGINIQWSPDTYFYDGL